MISCCKELVNEIKHLVREKNFSTPAMAARVLWPPIMCNFANDRINVSAVERLIIISIAR